MVVRWIEEFVEGIIGLGEGCEVEGPEGGEGGGGGYGEDGWGHCGVWCAGVMDGVLVGEVGV